MRTDCTCGSVTQNTAHWVRVSFTQAFTHSPIMYYSYPFSHCADGLISMADRSNIVGEVASTLAELASRWIQSGTIDFDLLIAATVDSEWARIHKPVISTNKFGHTLYTKFLTSEPQGMLVICHRNCGAEVLAKPKKNKVNYTCMGCGSTTKTTLFKSDKTTILGYRGLTKTPFPQEQYPTEWTLPKATLKALGKHLSVDSALPPKSRSTTPASTTPASTPRTTTPAPSTESDSDLLPQPGPSKRVDPPGTGSAAAKRQRRR